MKGSLFRGNSQITVLCMGRQQEPNQLSGRRGEKEWVHVFGIQGHAQPGPASLPRKGEMVWEILLYMYCSYWLMNKVV